LPPPKPVTGKRDLPAYWEAQNSRANQSGVASRRSARHDGTDEGDEYAHRLKEAGVAVTYRTFPGQFHGFFTMGKLLQQANIAASEIGSWLKALN
jgi:acetyl esterase/lipase